VLHLTTDLYSVSTLIAIIDESDCRISFNCLSKSTISLLVVIRTSSFPLEPRPKRDLATDLYSGSNPIAIKDESNRRISVRRLQKIYNITTRGDQGMRLSFGNPSGNKSHCRSILCLYPGSQLLWDRST
jgi:hypothetical protein